MTKLPIAIAFLAVLLLCLLSPTKVLASAGTCSDWKFACQNVQAFRQSKMDIPKKSSSCNRSPLERAYKLIERFKSKILGKNRNLATKNFNQKTFMKCLKDQGSLIQHLERDDLQTIRQEFKELGISNLDSAYIQKLFTDPKSSYGLLISRIEQDKTPYFYYRNYTLNGPYENLIESLTGFRAIQNSDGTVAEVLKYDVPGFKIIEKWGREGDLLQRLLHRAGDFGSSHQSQFPVSPRLKRDPITPAIAKILLFEVLRDRLANDPGEFQKLVAKIKLKFDYAHPFSQHVDPQTVSVHDGYFLGVEKQNLPSYQGNDKSASTGYDCTSLLQFCMGQAGLRFPPGFKLLSTRLAVMSKPNAKKIFPDEAQYFQIFNSRPYRCEEQLQPGDIITFPGHAFVFAGYGRDSSGKIQIQTYEAIAGEFRSFGKFDREIYKHGNACSQTIFSSLGQSHASIIRIAK